MNFNLKNGFLFFLFLNLVISCKRNDNTKLEYNLENPNFNKKTKYTIDLVLTDSLNIISPKNSSIDYIDSYIFKDSLFFGLNVVTNTNTIDVYDIKQNRFVKKIELPKHELKGKIRNVFVKSIDSIFLMNSEPPKIYLTNYNGKILRTYNGGILDLNVENKLIPKNEVIYSFSTPVTYQKPFVVNDILYSLIQPVGFDEVEGLRKTQRIAMLDLKSGKWIKAICKPEGIMSKEGVFYNRDLMSPYFSIAREKIYLSYPMSHYVFIYDLNGKLLTSHVVSSSVNKKMSSPMDIKTLNHRQKSWNFRIQTPFYGPIMYHNKEEIFTRIFYEKQDLYMKNGKLNNGSKRKAYIMIFDKNFKKIGEKIFYNGSLDMGYFTPLSDGLLIGRMPFYWKNENEFIQKYIYKFK